MKEKKDIIYILKKTVLIYTLFGIILYGVYLLNIYMPEIKINNNRVFWNWIFTWIFIAISAKIIIKWRMKNKIDRDERTNKLACYALSWSWTIALLTICAFMLTASFWWLNLDWLQISIIMFIELLFTGLGLQIYFYKKWDIC